MFGKRSTPIQPCSNMLWFFACSHLCKNAKRDGLIICVKSKTDISSIQVPRAYQLEEQEEEENLSGNDRFRVRDGGRALGVGENGALCDGALHPPPTA